MKIIGNSYFQLWTIYLEHVAANHKPNSEPYVLTMSILFDFWGKVTPAILKLISHSKGMSDMVNLHFVSVVEGLFECRSSSLSKLLPIWRPILSNGQAQVSNSINAKWEKLVIMNEFIISQRQTLLNTSEITNFLTSMRTILCTYRQWIVV